MANVISNVMGYKVVANNVVKSFNDVNDVVAYVVMILKKYPHNAVYVNGMGIRLERDADGRIGVVLRDSEFNLIRGYVMGKIKRGMVDAVSYVMGYVDAENVGSGFGDMYWDMISDSERVADTIENYLKNYTPSYLDKFGDCVICVYWDEFNEEDMNRLIEDDNFALQVKSLVWGFYGLMDFLVYDDGIYVTVDYDRMFNKVA